MTDRLGKTKMKASEFRFKPVKTWFGGDQTEKIEGWKTYVYEAAGKMKAVTITKACTPRRLILLVFACDIHLSIAARYTMHARASFIVHFDSKGATVSAGTYQLAGGCYI